MRLTSLVDIVRVRRTWRGTTESGQLPVFMAFQPVSPVRVRRLAHENHWEELNAESTHLLWRHPAGTPSSDITIQGQSVFLVGDTCSIQSSTGTATHPHSARPRSLPGERTATASGVVRTAIVEGTTGWTVAVNKSKFRAYLVGNGGRHWRRPPTHSSPHQCAGGSVTLAVLPFGSGQPPQEIEYTTCTQGAGGPLATEVRLRR